MLSGATSRYEVFGGEASVEDVWACLAVFFGRSNLSAFCLCSLVGRSTRPRPRGSLLTLVDARRDGEQLTSAPRPHLLTLSVSDAVAGAPLDAALGKMLSPQMERGRVEVPQHMRCSDKALRGQCPLRGRWAARASGGYRCVREAIERAAEHARPSEAVVEHRADTPRRDRRRSMCRDGHYAANVQSLSMCGARRQLLDAVQPLGACTQ
jgi:hypothetical protein